MRGKRTVAALLVAVGAVGSPAAVDAAGSTNVFEDVSARLIEETRPDLGWGDDLEITFRTRRSGTVGASADITETTTCGLPGAFVTVVVNGRSTVTAEVDAPETADDDSDTTQWQGTEPGYPIRKGAGRVVISGPYRRYADAPCVALGTRAYQLVAGLPTYQDTWPYHNELLWLDQPLLEHLDSRTVEYRNAALRSDSGAKVMVPGGPWRYEEAAFDGRFVENGGPPAVMPTVDAGLKLLVEALRPLTEPLARLLQEDLCGASDPSSSDCLVTVEVG